MKRMPPKIRLAVAFLGSLLAAWPLCSAEAATITFREGNAISELGIAAYSGKENLTLISSVPGGNYGGLASLGLGKDTGSGERKILLRFDVSQLAGLYESIDSVALTLTLLVETQGNAAPSVGVNLYQVANGNAGWVQGTKKGSFEAATSTWNHRATSTSTWLGSAGLGTAGTDYVSTAIDGTKIVQGGGTGSDVKGTQYTWDIPLSLFELWVDGENAGLLLSASAFGSLETADFLRFASDIDADETYRPQLVVQYTPVPEPASIVLIGSIAGLWLVRGARQRRERLVI